MSSQCISSTVNALAVAFLIFKNAEFRVPFSEPSENTFHLSCLPQWSPHLYLAGNIKRMPSRCQEMTAGAASKVHFVGVGSYI